MLCCFGRVSSAVADKPLSLGVSTAAGHAALNAPVSQNLVPKDDGGRLPCPGPKARAGGPSDPSAPVGSPSACEKDAEEPWRERLSQQLSSFMATKGLRAAGCWALSKKKCFLVAAAPTHVSQLRAMLHGFMIGSFVDIESDLESSVTIALSTKTVVSAVVPAGGPVPSNVPTDLRQLYDRVGQVANCIQSVQSGPPPANAWYLAALPLLSSGEAVGALMVAAQVGEVGAATNSADASYAMLASLLAEEFFGTHNGRASAENVCSLIAAVAAAPNYASAVCHASGQVHAHLIASDPQLPRLCVTPALVVSKNTQRQCTACSGSSPTAVACTGPQLQLYCNPCGKPTVVPVSETLVARAPVRADMLAAILTEALAAPVSSAALAAARAAATANGASRPPTGAGQQQHQHQQKRVALQCPEDEPPSSQCSELAVLEAAKARATRGSVVLVSCPLSSILCAVVVYICVAPQPAFPSSGDSAAVADGGAGKAEPSGQPLHAVQLAKVQLNRVLKLVASDIEVVACALEHRMLCSCLSLPLFPMRQGSKGPYVLDVNADTSGQLTVSVAATEAADDSNGFWGSASGDILSSELFVKSPSALPSSGGGGAAPRRSLDPQSHVLGAMPVGKVPPAALPSSPLGLCSSPASLQQGAGNGHRPQNTATGTLEALQPRPPASAPEERVSHLAQAAASSASAAATLLMAELEGPQRTGSQAVVAVSSQAVGRAHHESWDPQRPSGSLQTRGRGFEDVNALTSSASHPDDAMPDSARFQGCDTAAGSATTGASSAALATCSCCATSDKTNATTTGTWPAGGSGRCSRDEIRATSASLSLSLRPDSILSPSSRVPRSETGNSVMLPPTPPSPQYLGKGSGSITLVATARSRPVAYVAPTPQVPAAVVLPRTPPPELLRSASSGAGGGGGGGSGPLLQPGAGSAHTSNENPAYGYGKTTAEPVMLSNISGVRSFDSNGGGTLPGAGSGSSGYAMWAISRHRSKDWSDQAWEAGDTPSRTISTVTDGSTAPSRSRPAKVLSVDKAALQLPRTSGSAPNGLLMAPVVPHIPYVSAAAMEHREAAAAAAGYLSASVGSAGPPAPRPYVPHAPRRLLRMYLPPPPSGPFPTGIGVPLSPASVVNSTAMLASALGVSAAPTWAGSPVGSVAQVAQGPGSHSGDGASAARLLSMLPSSASLGTLFGVARFASTNTAPGPTPENSLQEPLPGAMEAPASTAGRTLHGLQQKPVAAAAWPPSAPFPAMPPPPPVPLQPHPSSLSGSSSAQDVAALAAVTSAAVGQKNRQLSDYAIPEDSPLESTVSETVQMMRMLSQARGMHLSARMKRVRVTAKIQSAHPGFLPANLPSQLARVALANTDGLFPHGATDPTAGAGGGGAPGSWVLTGVAARRGCIELVFDMVLVRGGEAAGGGPPAGAALGFEPEVRSGGGAQSTVARARGGRVAGAAHQASSALHPGSLHVSSGGGYVSFSQAQGALTHVQGGYRRWQCAEALAGPHMYELADAAAWATQLEVDDAGGAVPAGVCGASVAVDGEGYASEQEWVRSFCGLRPEALGEVFQQCGLLSPTTDPWVEVQVGHSPTGAATLLWDAASHQWVAKSPFLSSTSGGTTQQQQHCAGVAEAAEAAIPAPLEAPTLWLPCASALLRPGALALKGVRLVSKGMPGPGEVDEVTVRSSAGYLPVRVSAGLRTRHGDSSSGDGAGRLPLLLDEDPLGEQHMEGDCGWRLLDVLGPLPREGGLLLIECRRRRVPVAVAAPSVAAPSAGSASHRKGCGAGSSVRAAAMAGPCRSNLYAARAAATPTVTVVTSAPVPLVVLPERDAAAADELQRLRSHMTRLLMGLEDPLHWQSGAPMAPESVAVAAAAAAQVEMACQQFIMDLGTLLDAAAAAAISGAPSPPGPSSAVLLEATPSIAAGPSSMDAGPVAAPAVAPPRIAAQMFAGMAAGPKSLNEPGPCSGGHPTAVLAAANHSQSKSNKGSELLVSPACTTDTLWSMPSCSSSLNKVARMSEGGAPSVSGSGTAHEHANEYAGGLWSFAEDMRVLLSPTPRPLSHSSSQQYCQQHPNPHHQPPRQARDAVFNGAAGSGGASLAGGNSYADHLLDVACTLLAGCCAAGLLETALLVLSLAAGKLALVPPQVLLAEAGLDPRIRMDLLMAYTFRARGSRDSGRDGGGCYGGGISMGSPASSSAGAAAAAELAAAASVAVAGGSMGVGAVVAPLHGPRPYAGVEGPAAGGEAGARDGLSAAADNIAAVTSSMSHSHSLAVMLVGCRSSATTPSALSEEAVVGPQDGDSWGGVGGLDGEVSDPVAATEQQQQLLKAPANGGLETAWEAMTEGAVQSSLVPPAASMHAMAVGISRVRSTASDLPTWESMLSSATVVPEGCLAASLSSNSLTRGSSQASTDEVVMELPPASRPADRNAGADATNDAADLSSLLLPEHSAAEQSSLRPSAREATAVPQLLKPGSQAVGRLPAGRGSAPHGASPSPGLSSALSTGASCFTDPAPSSDEPEMDVASEPGSSQPVARPYPAATGGASDGHLWSLPFQSRLQEADYMRFVANRTRGITWSYFVYVTLISAVSCTRAWVEDGLAGCATLLLFSGMQGVIMGWYCLTHDAQEPRAMVAAAMCCKAVRMLADVLMGLRVLKVPSLMEPMALRGVEVFAEALMRPMAERVPLLLFCATLLLELPCVWLLYRHFYDIFPKYWLRDYPLLRTFVYTITALLVNSLAELYWRNEYRRWLRSSLGGSGPALDALSGAGSVAHAPAFKLHCKDE